MKQWNVWRWLTVTAAMVAIWLGGQGLSQVWTNSRLTQTIEGHLIDWTTRKTGRDRFAIWAHYTYRIDDQQFEGSDWLNQETYRNPWTIQREMERYPVVAVQVWHQGHRPDRSALWKRSPRRQIVMAFFAGGLACYFFWMDRRLRMYRLVRGR